MERTYIENKSEKMLQEWKKIGESEVKKREIGHRKFALVRES